MNLVDTRKPDRSKYAKTADGKIDFEAYKGLYGTVVENGMEFDVRVVDSRQRFGHLDLLCVPVSGRGQRWVEHKNISLRNDPASGAVATAPVAVTAYEPSHISVN